MYTRIHIYILCTLDVNAELFEVRAGDRTTVAIARYCMQ